MRRVTLILVCAVILVLELSNQSNAAVPQLMNYQGVLTDSAGIGLNTTVNIVFSIYDNPVAVSPIWTETQAVIVTDGVFRVLLGSVTTLSGSVFDDTTRYLGIKVGADPEILPRTRLVSVPFSFKSEHADVSDSAAFSDSTDAITDGGVDMVDISQAGAASGQVLKWNGSAWAPAADNAGSSWNWSDSSSHGPDSVLFADSANHADNSDNADFSDSTDAITDGGVDFADIGQNGATNGQVMKWIDGGAGTPAWEAADDEVSGGGGANGWVDDGTVVRLDNNNDSVGIGTATPDAPVHILKSSNSSSPAFGFHTEFSNTGTGGGIAANIVYNHGNTSGLSAGMTVSSTANSSDTAYGIGATASNDGTGPAKGGFFASAGSGTGHKYGIEALAENNATSEARGVYGIANNLGSGSATGGYFHAKTGGTGSKWGVIAVADANTASQTTGIRAVAWNFGTGGSKAATFDATQGPGINKGVEADVTTIGSSDAYGYVGNVSADAGTAYGASMNVTTSSGSSLAYGVNTSVIHSGSGTSYGGYFDVTGSGTGPKLGIFGSAVGSQTSNVFGSWSNSQNNGVGHSYGVFGKASSNTGDAYGASLEATSTTGNATGAKISATSDVFAIGADISSSSSGFGASRALTITATHSGEAQAYGVFLSVNHSGTGTSIGGRFGNNSTGTGPQYALQATVSGNHDALVAGASIIAQNDGTGVVYGVKSEVTNLGSGTSYGGYFNIDDFGTGLKVGVSSTVTGNQSSASVGVSASAQNFGSGNAIAVNGVVSAGGTGSNFGIFGLEAAGGSGAAVYAAGDLIATGTLTKGGGAFKIDHPLDPENKYLQHSFVESPDMMNVYNGNVVLDGNGEAVVILPDYFDVLNRDFRYQLTPVGAPGPNLYIAEKITGSTLRIAGGTSGLEVSWQVTGIRQDKWAEANRIQVELEKADNERGLYLHHEEYGMPIEKSVNRELLLEAHWKEQEDPKKPVHFIE